MGKPLISVVIPTKNSASTLGLCLASLDSQSFRDFELIIVDAFSTDETKEIAERSIARYFTCGASLTAARNQGFSKAKGRIFVSIDSDMILENSVLGDIAKNIPENDALIIPEIGYGTNFLSRCKDLEKRCYIGDGVIESSRAFSRETFEEIGGYDPNLHFGEDWDLQQRLIPGRKIGRTSAQVMHNTQNLSIVHDLRKAYVYGKTLHNYLAKRNRQSADWLSPGNFFFIKHFDKISREPMHALGLVMIKGLEYSAGLMGFVGEFFKRR